MPQFDLTGIYEFLMHTPEGGLKKILIDGQRFTEVHLNLLLKIVKTTSYENFCSHFEKKDYPKVKFNPNETKLKEKFWDDCVKVWQDRGLITPTKAA